MDPQAREAFREHVEARSPALLRTAYRLTGSHDAEDLLPTALARTCPAWGRVREREALDACARRTMVNTGTSWWRRRRLDEAPGAAPAEPRRTGAERDAGEDLALSDALRSALARLSRRQRAALVLRYYSDLSEAETAQVLGVTVGTVESTTSRALAELREDALADGLRDDDSLTLPLQPIGAPR